MLKRKTKPLLLFLLFLVLAFDVNAYEIPKVVKIRKDSGITVRATIDSNSEKLDSVYVDYLYDVIGANVIYYKIMNKKGIEGWIYNDSTNNWTSENSDKTKLQILLESGITMRNKPYDSTSQIVGLAKSEESYEILDVMFSHIKISTPRISEGWIYVGRPGDIWVEEIQ
ncbi:hypothetical protein ACFL0U_03785 [Pseudomonadota bacterium]